MAPRGQRSKGLRYQLEPDFRRELSTAEGCADLLLVVYREREKAAHVGTWFYDSAVKGCSTGSPLYKPARAGKTNYKTSFGPKQFYGA